MIKNKQQTLRQQILLLKEDMTVLQKLMTGVLVRLHNIDKEKQEKEDKDDSYFEEQSV